MIKYGDLIIFDDKHKLLCGDSTKKEDVKYLIGKQIIDLVITDPPYGVLYKGILNDKPEDLKMLLDLSFKNIANIMDKGSSIYVFHSDKMQIYLI